MKKTLTTVFLTTIFVPFFILLAALIVNDSVSRKTAGRLADLPLPEDTELIECVYEAGKLTGNGNGMQYFGAVLIRSGLPLEELRAYYSDFAENEWDCIVEKQAGAEIKEIEHGELAFQSEMEGDNYYIVYSWGESESIFGELDIRGH